MRLAIPAKKGTSMKHTNKKSEASILRQKAEGLLQNNPMTKKSQLSEAEILKLRHELEVHQIELEMQNHELSHAKHQAELTADKYCELYDFAPCGYFSISHEGEIIEVNLTGAQMLGNDRTSLKNKRFDFYIPADTRPVFHLFLETVFKTKAREFCEVVVEPKGNLPAYLHLAGIVSDKEEYCFLTATDITSRRKQEEEIKKINFELNERLKELNCHNRISEVMFNSDLSVDEVCEKIVHLIPPGCQFPEITEVKINIRDKVFQTGNFESSRNFLHQEIRSSGKAIGFIEVGLPDDKLPISLQKSLPEESDLLFSIAERIGNFIEKKEYDTAFLESREKYRNFFESLQDVYYEATVDGTLLEISPSIKIISKGQYSRTDLVGKSLSELYADPHARNAFFSELLKLGTVTDYELLLYNKDRSIVPVSISSRLLFDSDGKPVKIAGTMRDITDRKAAEGSLIKLSQAVEQSPVSIVITDLSGTIEYANAKACESTGYTHSELVGNNPRVLQSGEIPAAGYEQMWQTITSGKEWKGVFHNKKKNGDLYWESAAISPVFDAYGKITHFLAVKEDITARKKSEEDLKASEAALNYAQEIARMGSWEFNLITNKYTWSTNNYHLAGLRQTDTEISIGFFMNLVYPDDIPVLNEKIREAVGTKKGVSVDIRMLLPDGRLLWMENNIVPVFDGETLVTLKGVNIDITEKKEAETEIRNLNKNLELKIEERTRQLSETNEKLEKDIAVRKRTEDELRWNQSLLQMMASSSPLGFLVVDNRTDEILYFNHRFCQIWGIGHIEDQMQRGELRNNDIIPYCLPVLADIPAFAESCKPLQYEENRMVLEDEIAFLEERTIRRFTTQIRGIRDEYYGRFYIFEDISERKRSEKAVQQSELKHSTMISSISDVIGIMGIDGVMKYKSPNIEKYFGWQPEDLVGTDGWLTVHPDDLERLQTAFLDLLQKDDSSTTVEYQYKCKDGSYKQIELTGTNLVNNSVIKGVLLNYHDITERQHAKDEIIKSRDAANRANLAKSEFLSRMSHELRTPMNSILGFAQLMDMGELNPNQKKGVGHILNSGKHLLGLIDEVLDISRIESGRISFLPEPILVGTIISEIMDTVQPLADARQLNLELENSPENRLYVMSDRKLLKQVLINLLNNAVKYNRQGGSIFIKTETRQQDDKGVAFIRIAVTDTGIGIHPDDIPKLFIPFERIGAEKTLTEGTGLGLAVVKKIMEGMEGKVGVNSVFGQGSTFWIDLPATENQISWKNQQENNVKLTADLVVANNEIAFQNEEKAQRAAELVVLKKEYSLETGTTGTTNTGTILYIEDNIENTELVEEIIQNCRPGIRLITSIYGNTAVRLATDNLPDLILLDLDLPDMTGSEVLANLLADDSTKSIPVVILSADAMHYQIEKLITAGAREYLTKPLEVNIFLKVVDEWIEKGNKQGTV